MWNNAVVHYLLGLLYALAVVLQTLLLVSKDSLKRLKHYARNAIRSRSDSSNVAGKLAVIPEHLAVVFASEDLINYTQLADLVQLSIEHDIKRVSFYDPFSILYNARAEIREYIRTRQQNGLLADSNIIFDDDDGSRATLGARTISTSIMGPMHGKESLVRACRKFCRSPKVITSAAVQEYLEEEEGLFDPDFLIKVGPCYGTLAGYSPWNLRITEFYDIAGFSSAERITREEFAELLCKYASRDRRKGT